MTVRRAGVLTKYLKRWDRRLKAVYRGDGMIHVLFSDANVNQFVFALTDNWGTSGQPIFWGIEPVLTRLRQVDVSGNQSYLEEIRKDRAKAQESEKRDIKNNIEAGLYENRRAFAKSFEHVNTSTLDKTYDKRRIKGA